jgi:AcrR family transcriptional regulator
MAVRAAKVATISARGSETRARLIAAAIEEFSDRGFDGASTRNIARRAGANLAAIPYHFMRKQGLYRAAAHSIVKVAREFVGAPIADILALPCRGAASRELALPLLHTLLDRFARLVIGSREAESWTGFVMREELHPGAAFEILYTGFMRDVPLACARALAIHCGVKPDEPRVIVRAQAIIGEILIFRVGKSAALKLAGWKSYSPRRLDLIRSVIRENVDLIAGGRR